MAKLLLFCTSNYHFNSFENINIKNEKCFLKVALQHLSLLLLSHCSNLCTISIINVPAQNEWISHDLGLNYHFSHFTSHSFGSLFAIAFVCLLVCMPACLRACAKRRNFFIVSRCARAWFYFTFNHNTLSWARRLSPRVASMWCDVMYTRIDIMAYIALDYAYDTDIQTSVHTRYTYCFNLCTKRNKKSARIHHRYHAPVCLCVCLIKQFSTKQKLLH